MLPDSHFGLQSDPSFLKDDIGYLCKQIPYILSRCAAKIDGKACLDVLRALAKEPATADALLVEIGAARGLHPALDRVADALPHRLAGADEAGARRLVEQLALALQASLLLRCDSPAADAFCRSRLDGEHGLAMGTLPDGLPLEELLARALPD